MEMTSRRWAAVFAVATALALSHVAAVAPGDGVKQLIDDSIVYDVDRRVRFDHEKHADTPCATCHGAALTSERSADDIRPPMDACASCHAGEKAVSPKLESCGECHVGHDVRSTKPIRNEADWKAFRPAPMPRMGKTNTVRFDHARHVGLAKANGGDGCSSCHGSSTSARMKMPSMASCQSCHDGSANGPTADCATCHPTSGKTLKTNLPEGRLKPSNHGVNWEKNHGTVAASQPDECASCHLPEEDCAGCHVEEVARPFSVHPPNFLTIHAVDARSQMGDCTDCHRTETFCTGCHTDAKVVTRPIGRPPDRLQYHPPGWLDGSMANNHGVMARRNINDCVSCHVENDCVSCHTGVNPHPPGFQLECASLVKANEGMCRTCHTDVPPCL